MNTEKEFKTVGGYVKDILKDDERTRNNDTWLIIRVLRNMGFKIYIDYHEIKEMPSFETITRCRRKIQNEDNQFLPKEDIDKQRKRREDDIRSNINRWDI